MGQSLTADLQREVGMYPVFSVWRQLLIFGWRSCSREDAGLGDGDCVAFYSLPGNGAIGLCGFPHGCRQFDSPSPVPKG